MAEIPSDIRRDIILRLPAKSLIRFRAVCKSWRAIIDDPSFVKAHTNKQLSSTTILIRNSTGSPFYPLYSLDLQTLNFADGIQKITATPLNFTRSGLSRLSRLPVAACNGLMLITSDYVNKTWEIWNPFTHERLELPQRDFYSNFVFSGLGYDHVTDDYKDVVIDPLARGHGDKYVYETHVYSLKFNTWRKIMNCPCIDWWNTYGAGVFLSGALHWVSRDMIFLLDLTTEKYSKIELPPLRVRMELVIRTNHLDVLGGCLFLSDYGNDDYMFPHFDVWVMKDYGARDSWIKLFSVDEFSVNRELGSLRLVAYMKNKMQVVLQDHEGFYLFDVESNSVKMVSIHGLTGGLSAQSFQGSIFRLHDNCGVSKSVATERRTRKRKASKLKMKMADSRLMFCLRKSYSLYESHDTCYSMDSNCYSSS